MTEYTIDLNGKRYKLSEDFREAIEERARREYEKNDSFSCWWSIANPENYADEEWRENIHEKGDPILTIETNGVMVPWDRLDKIEADMGDDAGGMLFENAESVSPEEMFGRTHHSITPHDFEKVPEPQATDPEKIPPKPEELGDDPELVMFLPRHPDVEHTWSAGEAIAPMSTWVEWNVQQKANQPRPRKDKDSSHDAFESLCKIYDCEVVGQYTPTSEIPKESGQVERKGEEAYEDGKYGGGHWNV